MREKAEMEEQKNVKRKKILGSKREESDVVKRKRSTHTQTTFSV